MGFCPDFHHIKILFGVRLHTRVSYTAAQIITSKSQRETVRVSSLSRGVPMPGLVAQQLRVRNNIDLMQSLIACRNGYIQ